MLKLYTTDYCPYCHLVEREMKKLGLEENVHYQLVDASENPGRKELIDLGGKTQVPYLYIPEEKRGMYESLDIVRYMKTNAATIKEKAKKK